VEGWPGELLVHAASGGDVAVEAPSPDPPVFFEAVGHVPLPPYIRRGDDLPSDRERYQTVYAREEGSVAAPTAGLHFTPGLLADIEEAGIGVARVTLHVGWGTFSPLKGDWREHRIHPEWGRVGPEAAAAVNRARGEGRRVVAVGTTSARLLESSWDAASGGVVSREGLIDLYITPGFAFRTVDALLTNFHRPRSSLLLLVDAFASSDLMRRAYGEAIAGGYRLFSYGDAMLIR
jgi:S-adenosylmethionine:tRNA ribosyltransferase-isomerase